MDNLLNTYLKLEEKLKMEYMLKEHIYITYYADISDFKKDMFFLNDNELNEFFIDYQLDKYNFTKEFIILYNQPLDSYILWTDADNLNSILNYFTNNDRYKQFIV